MSETTPRPRALIADDNLDLLAVVRTIVAAEGFEVETATDGLAALEAVRTAGDFDLLVTDVEMPGLGGLDLAKAVRPGHPEMQIVVISGGVLPRPVELQGLQFLQKGDARFVPVLQAAARGVLLRFEARS